MKAKVLLSTAVIFAGALSAGNASAQHIFDGNIFWDNVDDCRGGSGSVACDHVAAFLNNDRGTDPGLADPIYEPADFPIQDPDFRASAAGIANGVNDAAIKPSDLVQYFTADDCFNCGTCDLDYLEDVCYRGALDPVSQEEWYAGWTNHNFDGTGRTDLDISNLIVVDSDIVGNETWTFGAGDGNGYLLRGRVGVPAGATLNIEAGVRIFGEKATTGYLVVERGGSLNISGTAAAPVIFTSDQLNGEQARQDWGGVVLHGRSIANCADCIGGASCESEGGAGDFCGNDDCDNKGTIRYARVEYAGIDIGENNELNAWTFNAVGCETVLEYLQSHMAWDDSFEWFGGKAQGKYWIATGGRDDNFDWQMGFRGALQFAIAQQYDDVGDSGIEADNNEFDFDAPCRSNPIIANFTFVGNRNGGSGIRLRRGTDAQVVNGILVNWDSSGGLRIDDAETLARGLNPAPAINECIAANVDDFEVESGLTVQTWPNPVVDKANFQFQLPKAGNASLTVFDANGRLVDTVVEGNLSAGQHSIDWNAPSAAGTYYYQLRTEDGQMTGRLVSVE